MQVDQTKLQSALKLAAAGFHVFPLRSGSKLPAIKDWQKLATRDEQTIKTWWSSSDHNIAIVTSKFGDRNAILALDVDNKADKRGDEAPRDLWRLPYLREWSHEEIQQVFP